RAPPPGAGRPRVRTGRSRPPSYRRAGYQGARGDRGGRGQEEIARIAPATDRPTDIPARTHHGPGDAGGGGTTLTSSGTEPIVSPGIDTTRVPIREPGAGGKAACGSTLMRCRRWS